MKYPHNFPPLITHSILNYCFNIFMLTAFITILANDDGPGVCRLTTVSTFLRELTAVYIQESMAVLYIVREPAQGTVWNCDRSVHCDRSEFFQWSRKTWLLPKAMLF